MNDEIFEQQHEVLELEMQELEALEAPGFWTGVSIGVAISASVATSVAVT
jgi:hypothetical protein